MASRPGRHVSRGRVWAAWLLALLACVAGVWWSFFYPYRLVCLQAVLPPNSVTVTQHEGLAERWETFLTSPELVAALDIFGDGVAPLLDPAVVWLVEAVGKRPVLTAYVPEFGQAAQPAWIAVGWAGGLTQLLRFGWFDELLGDFHACELPGAVKGWRMAVHRSGRPPAFIGLAVLEGVVAVVYSDDPLAIGALAGRLRLRGAGGAGALARAVAASAQGAPQAKDRLRGGDACAFSSYPDVWLRDASLVTLDRDGFTIEAALGGDLAGALTATGEPSLLSRFPQDFASMLCTLPVQNLTMLCARYLEPEVAGAVDAAVGPLIEPEGVGFLALGAPGYAGKLVGVPVPSLVAAFELSREARGAFDTQLRKATDQLNGEFKLGMMAAPSAKLPGVYAVSPLRAQSQLLPGRSAWFYLGVADGWLLASSDERVLARLMGHVRGVGDIGSRPVMPPSSVRLWMDGPGVSWSIRRVLAAYRIYAAVSSGGTVTPSEEMETAEQVCQFLERCGAFRVVASPRDGDLQLSVTGSR